MKKVTALLIMIMILTGCSGNKITKESFTFETANEKLVIGEKYEIDSFKDSLSFFESENCALGDKNIVYMYSDYQVETYIKNNMKYIYSIYFLNDNVKTKEGIKLYDSFDCMVEVYGDNYVKNENLYTYTNGNVSLNFILQNDIIISIEYKDTNI